MTKRILLSKGSAEPCDLEVQLKAIGCKVEATHFEDVVHVAAASDFDVILLVADGKASEFLTVLAGLQALPSYPPLLLISPGFEDPMLSIKALKCGCDGALNAPVDLLHLDAWMEALIRRKKLSERFAASEDSLLRVGEIEIDLRNRTVRTRKTQSPLTEREFEVLLYLARNHGRVCTRQELLEAVWESSSPSLHGTLNTHINRIRIKIEEDLKNPRYLFGIYGLGYRLVGGSASGVTGESAADQPVSLSPAEQAP
jgi:DNA-binding response OmpR family regulator